MIHIVVGHEAAKNLEAAFEIDENLQGEIIVLRDTLGIGPLQIPDGESFSNSRTGFWKNMIAGFEEEVKDEEVIRETIEKARQEEEPLCFWMAPCVSDVCAYFWLLPMFKAEQNMLHVINIVGLPFLNEKGQLFYPNNFSQIPPKEFTKTKRLLKEVTLAEFEVDGDEWARLSEENGIVRIYDGGKKIVSKPNSQFDSAILNGVGVQFIKANKVINDALKKIPQTLSNHFIEWRLKELILSGELLANGDPNRPLKELEVKKPGEPEPIPDPTNS